MYEAFDSCKALTNVPNIPNSVTTLYYAFYNCRNLNCKINIGTGLTNISRAFAYCVNYASTINIYSNSVSNCRNIFYGASSNSKKCYVYAGTTTNSTMMGSYGNGVNGLVVYNTL